MTGPPPFPADVAPDGRETDLSLLLALDALLREPNVTRAAARLGISQPAMSARLGRLRKLFDDPLFVPAANGRGMVPTPRASALRDRLADTLGQLRGLLGDPGPFDPASSRRDFVVAIREQPAAILAPALVRALRAEAPGIRLSLVTPDDTVADRLEDGGIDLLIAPAGGQPGRLMARTLLVDRFVTAQRQGHPRGTAPLDLDAFCALDHLVVSTRGPGFTGVVDAALAAGGRRRRVALSIESYALAPRIVAGSDILCTLPARLLQPYADTLDLFPPPLDLPPIPLAAMWHARSTGDPGHAWLRDLVYRSAAGEGDAGN